MEFSGVSGSATEIHMWILLIYVTQEASLNDRNVAT